MKRIEESHRHELPYCKLFREELEEVIELMTIDGEGPKLVSGKFEFESKEELFQYLGEDGQGEITISRTRPWVRVTSDGIWYATIYSSDSGDASVALFQRLVVALRHCVRPKPLRDRGWFALAAGAMLALGAAGAADSHTTPLKLLFAGIALLGAGMIISTFATTFTLLKHRRRRDTVFYGVPRNSRKSFWQRKRDDILVSVFSGLFGAVLGVGGTLAAQWLSK